MTTNIHTVLIWASTGFGFLAAFLWFYACVVKVEPKPDNPDGLNDFVMIALSNDTGQKTDILRTAEKQTLWNKRAAILTALAMFFQALSQLITNPQ